MPILNLGREPGRGQNLTSGPLCLHPSGSQFPTSQRDPHQEHEEDKEDIGDKVGRSQDAVGIVDSIVVKVPKDDPELSETERQGSGLHPEPNHNPDPYSYPQATFLIAALR